MIRHVTYGVFAWVCSPLVTYNVNSSTQLSCSWEFLTTLDYEWKVIYGRIPYRWTIWVREFVMTRALPLNPLHLSPPRTYANFLVQQIYIIARVACLVSLVINAVLANLTSPINCMVRTISNEVHPDFYWLQFQGLDLFTTSEHRQNVFQPLRATPSSRPSFHSQFSNYLALATASLLIVLRM